MLWRMLCASLFLLLIPRFKTTKFLWAYSCGRAFVARVVRYAVPVQDLSLYLVFNSESFFLVVNSARKKSKKPFSKNQVLKVNQSNNQNPQKNKKNKKFCGLWLWGKRIALFPLWLFKVVCFPCVFLSRGGLWIPATPILLGGALGSWLLLTSIYRFFYSGPC